MKCVRTDATSCWNVNPGRDRSETETRQMRPKHEKYEKKNVRDEKPLPRRQPSFPSKVDPAARSVRSSVGLDVNKCRPIFLPFTPGPVRTVAVVCLDDTKRVPQDAVFNTLSSRFQNGARHRSENVLRFCFSNEPYITEITRLRRYFCANVLGRKRSVCFYS